MKSAGGATGRATFSFAMYRQFLAENQTMEELFACAPYGRANIVVDGRAEIANAFISTGNYYRVLGLTASPGRTILPDDDRPGAPAVATISHKYWRSRLASDPNIVGKTIDLDDMSVTVLGVLPADFRFHDGTARGEAVEIWAPLYDRIVALFLETVENGWPCQKYPNRWPDRALALLSEYEVFRKQHSLSGKLERARNHQTQLREFLGRSARQPKSLSGREVGRIRVILDRYVAKRGVPGSSTCTAARASSRSVRAPSPSMSNE